MSPRIDAPLVTYVRGDSEFVRVRRRGRFAIPKDCAVSPHHLAVAVKENQELMIGGLEKQGYRYAGKAFEVVGPLDHIVFSEDNSPDRGVDIPPDVALDPDKRERWERAQKAMAAKRRGAVVEMCDYELVTEFDRRVPSILRPI